MNRRIRRVNQAVEKLEKGINFDMVCDSYNLTKKEVAQVENLQKRVILANGNIRIGG